MNWMQQRTKNVSDQELLRMDDDIGTLRQGCSLGLDVSISRRSRDVVSKRLGLVSISYHIGSHLQANIHSLLLHCKIARTSFWIQGVYWFASLLIYCNASAWDCEWPVLFYINSFNLNVAIHCFDTMLKVEGLEKRLGLGLARSRSRLVAKIRRLGLVS